MAGRDCNSYHCAMALVPRVEDATSLCESLFNCAVKSISRFPTGLCHYVYDVVLADGRAIVARIATEENRRLIKGGIFWSGLLGPLGVPVPALLQGDAEGKPLRT